MFNDKEMQQETLDGILRILQEVQERAGKDNLSAGHYDKVMKETNFMKALVGVLEDRGTNSGLSTVVLGLLTINVQKPAFASNMMKAFLATMTNHLMEDMMERMLRAKNV